MPRIKDLQNYTGALNRADIFFAVDGNSFSRGMSLSGQQVHTLCKGIDGKNIELRSNSTHIQWRWEGDATWGNLIAVSSLKGEDAKDVEIRIQSGYIQTRLTGGTWSNLIDLESLKGPKGDNAVNPNLTFQVNALAADATPTSDISGTYPNMAITLGLPKGHDAALPDFTFQVNALPADATPTSAITGTYPNLVVALGLPKGHDAALPAFTFETEKGNPGTNPDVTITGSYPDLNLKFSIPEGLRGEQGKPLVVLANGNYGNWDEATADYIDSGLPASATVDIENATVSFTESALRENLIAGEKIPVLFGKLRKWFSDLGPLAWKTQVDYQNDIENLPVFKQIFGESVLGTGDIAPENVKDIAYNPTTQAFTVSYYGGRLDETISMPADNFLSNASYDGVTHILTLTMSNNNQVQVPLDDLIDEYKVANDGGLEVINGNEFKLTDGLKNKIDEIEAGAQKNKAQLVDLWWDQTTGVITISFSDAIASISKIYIHKTDGSNLDGDIGGSGGSGTMTLSGVTLTSVVSTSLTFTPLLADDILNDEWILSIR